MIHNIGYLYNKILPSVFVYIYNYFIYFSHFLFKGTKTRNTKKHHQSSPSGFRCTSAVWRAICSSCCCNNCPDGGRTYASLPCAWRIFCGWSSLFVIVLNYWSWNKLTLGFQTLCEEEFGLQTPTQKTKPESEQVFGRLGLRWMMVSHYLFLQCSHLFGGLGGKMSKDVVFMCARV